VGWCLSGSATVLPNADERERTDGTDQRAIKSAEPAQSEQPGWQRFRGGSHRGRQDPRLYLGTRPARRIDVSDIAVGDGISSALCLGGGPARSADGDDVGGHILGLDGGAQRLG